MCVILRVTKRIDWMNIDKFQEYESDSFIIQYEW